MFQIRSVREIGAGGLGRVDEVVVTASNQSHAVGTRFARKRLGAQWANDPNARIRFDREIQTMSAMRHPTIVPCVGYNAPGSTERWYLMPLYWGSLRDWLTKGGRGTQWKLTASIGAGLANALSHAHSLNLCHRDLKPDNILMDQKGNLAIADWGLGQFIHKNSKVLNLTRGGLGTEYYCSIEQWNTGNCGPAGDVYSLGVTLAEMAIGFQTPISPVGVGIRQDIVPNDSYGAAHFNAVIKKMTDVMAQRRYQTMAEVESAMRTAESLG
jgi:serine/threonine-protein kinase